MLTKRSLSTWLGRGGGAWKFSSFLCQNPFRLFLLLNFADSPHHVISFSLGLCRVRKKWTTDRPVWMNREGKEQRNGFISVYSRLPFDLCLLNITSAEVRDRQEAKTMAGKLPTHPTIFTFCPKHFMNCDTFGVMLWLGKFELRNYKWL